jgi:hypothetical protein
MVRLAMTMELLVIDGKSRTESKKKPPQRSKEKKKKKIWLEP